MTKCGVELTGYITVTRSDGEPLGREQLSQILAEHLDRVMEELQELAVEDPEIDLAIEDDGNHVRIAVIANAVNPWDASNLGAAAIRTAIHAAGGGTPDWPDPPPLRDWALYMRSLNSSQLTDTDDPPAEHKPELART